MQTGESQLWHAMSRVLYGSISGAHVHRPIRPAAASSMLLESEPASWRLPTWRTIVATKRRAASRPASTGQAHRHRRRGPHHRDSQAPTTRNHRFNDAKVDGAGRTDRPYTSHRPAAAAMYGWTGKLAALDRRMTNPTPGQQRPENQYHADTSATCGRSTRLATGTVGDEHVSASLRQGNNYGGPPRRRGRAKAIWSCAVRRRAHVKLSRRRGAGGKRCGALPTWWVGGPNLAPLYITARGRGPRRMAQYRQRQKCLALQVDVAAAPEPHTE